MFGFGRSTIFLSRNSRLSMTELSRPWHFFLLKFVDLLIQMFLRISRAIWKKQRNVILLWVIFDEIKNFPHLKFMRSKCMRFTISTNDLFKRKFWNHASCCVFQVPHGSSLIDFYIFMNYTKKNVSIYIKNIYIFIKILDQIFRFLFIYKLTTRINVILDCLMTKSFQYFKVLDEVASTSFQ